MISTTAFYSFSERKAQFPFNIFRMVEVYNFPPSTAIQKYEKMLKNNGLNLLTNSFLNNKGNFSNDKILYFSRNNIIIWNN